MFTLRGTDIMLSIACLGLVHIFLLQGADAMPQFQQLIPNGANVPNPCDPTENWPGVGHLNSGGGGPLNVFGEAFQAAGLQWTSDLCNADSDGDGLSNGEELGDPNCVWSEGDTPEISDNLSHPGFAECASNTGFLQFHQPKLAYFFASCVFVGVASYAFN